MQRLQKDREDIHVQHKQESQAMLDRFKELSSKTKSQDEKQQQLLTSMSRSELEVQNLKADIKKSENQIRALEKQNEKLAQ